MRTITSISYILTFLFLVGLNSQSTFAQENDHVKGELLIQLDSETDPFHFKRTFEAQHEINISQLNELSSIMRVYQLVFLDNDIDLDKCISLFSDYPGLINIQKNHLIEARESIPNDTLFSQQWFHKNTGQTGGNIDADIDTPDAWDITVGGTTTHNDTIVVCIIEGGGVDINHIDLVDNIWHNHAEIPDDGIDNDNNGYIDDYDGWNVATLDDAVGFGDHGTKVAGMVGASGNNTTGVSGVNQKVKMMIIRGQVATNEASVIAAYNYPLIMRKKYNESYGQEGAFVVVTNASWGINNGNPANYPLWCAMYDTLGAYGVLSVAATSNNNVNVDLVGDMPTTCTSDCLISVTMTNSQDIRAGSGYGPIHIDLAAPGSSVYLTAATGLYSTTSGTSFASPCVVGAVALAYSTPCPEFINFVKYDPAAAALDMRDYILSSVDFKSVLTGEVATSGRLNVKNAIDSILANCALGVCTPPYNLITENISDTSVNFTWAGFSTNYLLYIQEGNNPAIEFPVNGFDTLAFDTLIPCTNYTVWLKGICGTDTSAASYLTNFETDGCCNNPDLIEQYSSKDTLVITWNPILYATEYDFRYRKNGDLVWITTLLDTVSPLTFAGLDSCTEYEFQIKTICFDSTHDYSVSTIFKTKGCGACYEASYCEISGGNTNSEWIESVVIGSNSSITGENGGWYQSQNILHGFVPGQTYTASITPGYSGFNFTERISLWIDFDQSGTFEPGEKLMSDVNTNTVATGPIAVPVSSAIGVTKMRIGMNGENAPIACQTSNFFGEYEDYCVYIGADASVTENQSSFNIFPNPTNGMIIIETNANVDKIEIHTLDGKQVYSSFTFTGQVDLTSFERGVYLISFSNLNGISTQKIIKN